MGQIRGPGVSLRVMFEDVSSCIFNGKFNNDTGSGAYICMLSVGIERGVWQVKREGPAAILKIEPKRPHFRAQCLTKMSARLVSHSETVLN